MSALVLATPCLSKADDTEYSNKSVSQITQSSIEGADYTGLSAYMNNPSREAEDSSSGLQLIVTAEENGVSAKVGLSMPLDGPKNKRGFFRSLTNPWVIYRRAKDSQDNQGKFFPYFRENTWPTIGRALGEILIIGGGAAGMSGGSSGGSGSDSPHHGGDV